MVEDGLPGQRGATGRGKASKERLIVDNSGFPLYAVSFYNSLRIHQAYAGAADWQEWNQAAFCSM